MDKRTLLFVFGLTLALFGVNLYFDQQRQEDMRQWNAKNETVLLQERKKIEGEIATYSIPVADVPAVDLYAEESESGFQTSGVLIDKTIFTLAWEKETLQKVFVRKHGTQEPFSTYQISFLPENLREPILYQQTSHAFKYETLDDFNTYYLHLFIPAKGPNQPSELFLGRYSKGNFSILTTEKNVQVPSAIAFLKNNNTFLPVGFYDGHSKKLIFLNEIKGLKNLLQTQEKRSFQSTKSGAEQFYVLESPYQQLVFSNYGGALAEINLPFKSKSDEESVVREIEYDREMVQKHPFNAHFPSRSYFSPGENKEGPFVEQPQGGLGGYYPLLRRNLIRSSQKDSVKISPKYYGLNIVSEYPEVAELVYEVKSFDKNSIVFEASTPHRRITKTYSFANEGKEAPYVLNLVVKIDGDSRGLWLSSGVPEVEIISGSPAPALKYRITRNQKPYVESIELTQDTSTTSSLFPDWIANSNGFLGIIQDPLDKIDPGFKVQKVSGVTVPSRLVEIDLDNQRFKADQMPGYITLLPLRSTGGTMNFRIFAGPFGESVLKQVDQIYSVSATGYNPDYIASQTFHGWFAFISEPFAKFLFILMKFFYSVTGSWGFSIILLTVALRIMMYPLNAWSTKSMIKMQKISPEVTAIQEKYKKDPKTAQLEIMNLYRERGVNPMSGCLPLIIQMPFLIGMFDLLKSTFELRGASFIPGWIDNLTAPDVLFSWNTPIFFIGNEFHLLPILLGLVMFLQQRLMSPLPKDPKLLTDQQRQQRAMGTIMSVVFTIMFYNFPSGLNIYWLSSMLLGILQQWWTTRQMQKPAKEKTLPAKG